MSITAFRMFAVVEAMADFPVADPWQTRERLEARARALASYLIGRFA